MLHLIPAPLHRRLYRIAHAVRLRWLRLRGGTIYGCSMVARDAAGRVLLVRHSYGSDAWEFPGGGMRRGEDAEAAVRREFAEELGCGLREVEWLGRMEDPFHGATNVVEVFTGLVDGEPRPDGRELVAVRFFAPDALPQPSSRRVARRMEMLAGR